MAKKNCNLSFDEALQALGLRLSNENRNTFAKIVDELIEKANGIADETRKKAFIKKYRDMLIKEVDEAEKVRVKNALIDAAIEIELTRELDANENLFDGLRSMLVGSIKGDKGAGYSIDAIQKAILDSRFGLMAKKLRAAGVEDAAMSGKHDDDIIREAYEYRNSKKGVKGAQPGKTGNETAIKIAPILSDILNEIDKDLIRAGALRNLNDTGTFYRQTHDRTRILEQGEEAWIKYVLDNDLVDVDRTFGADDPATVLSSIYASIRDQQNIVSEGAKLEVTGWGSILARQERLKGLTGRYNIARRASREPIIYFKNADAQIQYNERFGRRGLIQSIIYDLETQSRNLGLMQRLGTNPRAMLGKLKRHAKTTLSRRITAAERAGDTKKAKKLSKGLAQIDKTTLDRWMDTLDGTSLRISGDGSAFSAASIGAFLRAIQVMSKLGGATLAAFTDIPLSAGELMSQGIGFGKAFGSGFKSLRRGRGNDEIKKVANSIGLGLDGMLGAIHAKFGATDSVPGASTKLMQKFFKYNLMSWWNDSHRTGMALTMSHNLASFRKTKFADLPDRVQEMFKMYHIEELEWDIYRKYGRDESIGLPDDYLLADGIDNLTDEQIAQYVFDSRIKQGDTFLAGESLENLDKLSAKQKAEKLAALSAQDKLKLLKKYGEVGIFDPQAIRFELKNKLNTMYINRADAGVIMPGAWEKTLQTGGQQAGTFFGEFMRYLMQFKTFPITVTRRALGREWHRGSVGSFTTLIATTTLFGYFSMVASDLTRGRKPREIPFFGLLTGDTQLTTGQHVKLFLQAATKGGGFGIYGDFLLGEYNRYGRSALASIAGPTIGQLDDVFGILGKLKTGDVDVGAEVFRTLINNAPYSNLFYTRAALNYLILYDIQEMLNPGYLRRMERRIMKDNNQAFYLPPSSTEGLLR